MRLIRVRDLMFQRLAITLILASSAVEASASLCRSCSAVRTADFRSSRVEILLLQTMQQMSAGGNSPRRAATADSVPGAAVGLAKAQAAGGRIAGGSPAGASDGDALLVALQLSVASREREQRLSGPSMLAVVFLLLASCASWLWCFARFARSEPDDKQQAVIPSGAPGSGLLPRAAAGGPGGAQGLQPEPLGSCARQPPLASAGPGAVRSGPLGSRPLPPPPPIGSLPSGLLRDPFVDTRRGNGCSKGSGKGTCDVGSKTCVSGHYLRKTTAPLQPPVCSRPASVASLPSPSPGSRLPPARESLLGTREVVRQGLLGTRQVVR